MRYFYDTEFIEDGTVIDLVSIGVVAEDGREFYAVSTEFDERQAGDWVRRNVLPLLPPRSDKAWMSRAEIRRRLFDFLVPNHREGTGCRRRSVLNCGRGSVPTTMSPWPSCGVT